MSTESRSQRKKREVRGRILAAAQVLFDQEGVDATTVEQICERADIAVRTFFNYFPSKRHIVHELAIEAALEVAARIRAVHRDGDSTRERLMLFFARSAEVGTKAGPMHRELLSHLIAINDIPADLQHARNAMLELLRDGVRAGDVGVTHPLETLADVILGTFYRLIIDWTNQDDYPIEVHLAHAAAFLCDAVAPGKSRPIQRH
jgi:AcrR family transcriptional regulator